MGWYSNADGSALPIEQVEPGDQVLCDYAPANEDGLDIGLVYEAYARVTDHPLDLTLELNGDFFTVTTTPEHPFFIPASGEFVAAGDLAVGACFAVAEGEEAAQLVAVNQRYEPTVVYNFHVLGAQNYFVKLA